MSPEVLRRKLQKRAKHKPFRKCPQCGGRTRCRVVNHASFYPKLDRDEGYVLAQRCENKLCGFSKDIT